MRQPGTDETEEATLDSGGEQRRGRPPASEGNDGPSWSVPNDFADYARVLLRWRRGIVLAVAAAMIGSALFSLLTPEIYEARATLLPEQSKGFSFSSVGEGGAVLDFLAGTGGGPRQDSRLFLELLESRTVFENVVRRLDLIKAYGLDHLAPRVAMEEAVVALHSQVKFILSDAGTVVITSRVSTPFLAGGAERRSAAERAAALSNAFAEELNAVNREKSTSRARMVREYIEEQLHEAERRSTSLSDSLVAMQSRHGLVAIEEQTKAEILTVGELRGQLVSAEVELGILQKTMTPGNPQVVALHSRVAELRRQYERLQVGDSRPGAVRETGMALPLSQLPAAAQAQGRLLLELKIQQTVYEILSQQYYQARVRETGEIPSFSVLDPAQPPVYRSAPKRTVLVLTATFVAAFAAVLVAFSFEYRDRRQGRERPRGPRSLGEAWREDRAALGLLGRGRPSKARG